jgi:hypothetical protein
MRYISDFINNLVAFLLNLIGLSDAWIISVLALVIKVVIVIFVIMFCVAYATWLERKIHGLITDGTPQIQVTNYYMRYLKTPNDIVVNLNNPSAQISCELDSLTHQGICDIALKLLAAAVREQIPITQLTADSLE